MLGLAHTAHTKPRKGQPVCVAAFVIACTLASPAPAPHQFTTAIAHRRRAVGAFSVVGSGDALAADHIAVTAWFRDVRPVSHCSVKAASLDGFLSSI